MAQQTIRSGQIESLDAAKLTGTVASARLTGTYAISISGNAATATSATTATTATTASNSNALGGVAAASWAKLASPAFTGNPTAPTQAGADNSTKLATTAFVQAAVAGGGSGTVYTTPAVVLSSAYGVLKGAYAHGLGGYPDIGQLVLYCVGAEFGFNVGDYVVINPSVHDFDETSGAHRTSNLLTWNTTNVWFTLAYTGFGISGKTSAVGGYTGLTGSNWYVYARLVKF